MEWENKMTEQKPENFTVQVTQPNGETADVEIYCPDGQTEYLNMANAAKYLGRARYTSDLLIKELAKEKKIQRYEFVGHAKWVLRTDLDEIKIQMRRAKPLSE